MARYLAALLAKQVGEGHSQGCTDCQEVLSVGAFDAIGNVNPMDSRPGPARKLYEFERLSYR